MLFWHVLANYFEDQYMFGQGIVEDSPRCQRFGVKVIGLIPHQSISGDFDAKYAGYFPSDKGRDILASARLSKVIRIIYGKDADPQKLTFLFSPLQTLRGNQGSICQNVHSKVFIMDDAFCTIGSMNFNRRSTTHDSELSLRFCEPNPNADSFAKQLRVRLWQSLLGLPSAEQHLINDPL
jgi:phosphatidylserine/phosphatidylglycerophosphate/cardiolipin synthase-like enzyme